MTTNKIEIIIPTHNELETVDELIERINTVRTDNDLSLCLTFVDDSNDGTHSLIEEKIKGTMIIFNAFKNKVPIYLKKPITLIPRIVGSGTPDAIF